MDTRQRFAVLGAGNGGYAMAAELALLEKDVRLFDFPRFDDRLEPIRVAGGITVDSRIDHFPGGRGRHFAPLSKITTDIGAAVAGADIVVPVVPGQHHARFIDALLPHLVTGQLVLVNPGGVGGTLVWRHAFEAAGVSGLMFAQPSDLLYAGRRSGPARVTLGGKKRRAALGIFPNADRDRVIDRLGDVFPEFTPVANALEAGLGGPGMMLHPLPMLMNAAKMDREAPYTYDAYDITPTVARAIEVLDGERTAIIEALGGKPTTCKDVLTEFYGVRGRDFYDSVTNVEAYKNATSPADFSHRYITEEIPTQFVPATLIGERLGVATPVIDAVINLAVAVTGDDYRTTGWTLERLGLEGLDRDGILDFLETGRR